MRIIKIIYYYLCWRVHHPPKRKKSKLSEKAVKTFHQLNETWFYFLSQYILQCCFLGLCDLLHSLSDMVPSLLYSSLCKILFSFKIQQMLLSMIRNNIFSFWVLKQPCVIKISWPELSCYYHLWHFGTILTSLSPSFLCHKISKICVIILLHRIVVWFKLYIIKTFINFSGIF